MLVAFQEAENEKLGPFSDAYEDIYDVMPPRLHSQLNDIKEHVQKYKEHYNLDKYKSS